jgi:hypothetical protein
VLSAQRLRRGSRPAPAPRETQDGGCEDRDLAREQVEAHGIEPRSALVLPHGADACATSLPEAVRYVLRVPTNATVIVADALGYFFFAGFRFFGIEWLQHH